MSSPAKLANREISYLRISLTDCCNFKCMYCRDDSPRPMIARRVLAPIELARVVAVLAGMGIRAVRLTGGEPTLRPELIEIVERISSVPGIEDVSLTTNGSRLRELAIPLRRAGLRRVNVSIDSMKPEVFKRITRFGSLAVTWDGIHAALDAGLVPVKLNVVALANVNESELQAFAELAHKLPLHVRFIALMAQAGGALLADAVSLEPFENALIASGARPVVADGYGPARVYSAAGWQGTVGIIDFRRHNACSACNRIRLTSDGQIVPCLHSDRTIDLCEALDSHNDDRLRIRLIEALAAKPLAADSQFVTAHGMAFVGG